MLVTNVDLRELRAVVIGFHEASTRVNYKKRISKTQAQLEKGLSKLFAKHSVAVLKEFARFKSRFSESVSDDEFDTLFDQTAPTAEMCQAIEDYAQKALTAGADALISLFDVDTVFSLKNPRAVAYFNNYGANLVAGINKTSKSQLRTILQHGIDNGWSYDKLDRSIREKFNEFSTTRAARIAVTEIGNAYQEGNMIVARDLSASGLQMEKSWLTVNDDRVDDHCKANQNEGWIPVDQTFSSGADRPLDHPACRCVLQFRRKPA